MSLTTPDKIGDLQRKLYGKAKAEPAYRFYLLYDKIYRPDILEHAYELARENDGAPGVDGVTFEMIEAAGVEGWLAALRHSRRETASLRSPNGPRLEDVSADAGAAGDDSQTGRRGEASGHSHDPGPGRPNRRQAGAGTEADLEDCAYGYRPGRSALDAVEATQALLRRGYVNVVDADLSKYFDTIPHRELMQSVARRIVDPHVPRLIKLWLRVPVEGRDGKGKRRLSGGKTNRRGTPP